ncbi:MAG: MBL fold metallo-hydrolase, partial [Planctomycetota bacterium]
MMPRRELFPGVLEMNYQARRRLGCCVYLVYDADEWMLIDIGYEETVDEIVDMIRQMDFPLAQCKYVVASHADVDHVQGLHRLKQALPNAQIVAHPESADLIEQGDRVTTYAEIPAQGISIDLRPVPVDRRVDEGDTLTVGGSTLKVWHTPGHTEGQLA